MGNNVGGNVTGFEGSWSIVKSCYVCFRLEVYETITICLKY